MASLNYQTLKQKQPIRQSKQLPSGVYPIRILWEGNDQPATIEFSDGLTSAGSCIRCINPPCIEYSDAEIELEVFNEFPADKNNAVCPTAAIVWPFDEDAPHVDSSICIMCGVCLGRCPVRAIFLDADGSHINDEPNTHFGLHPELTNLQIIESTTKLFEGIAEEGVYFAETDQVLETFSSRFDRILRSQSSQFPNHLARNLLIACGIGSAMRRRGDTNIRMDLVLGPPGVERGTGEVEMAAVLEAPRDILDNVAVLVARYQLPKEGIVPIIVTFALPNLRSEYWQVIKDIKDVLDIRVCTITIGALMITVWSRTTITIETGEELYVDVDSPSLRAKLQHILGRDLTIASGYPGLLESVK